MLPICQQASELQLAEGNTQADGHMSYRTMMSAEATTQPSHMQSLDLLLTIYYWYSGRGLEGQGGTLGW